MIYTSFFLFGCQISLQEVPKSCKDYLLQTVIDLDNTVKIIYNWYHGYSDMACKDYLHIYYI